MIEITDFRKDKYHFVMAYCLGLEGYMVSRHTFNAYFGGNMLTYRIVIHCYMVNGGDGKIFTDFYAVPTFDFWDKRGISDIIKFAFDSHEISYEDFNESIDKYDYYWLAVEKNDDRIVRLSSNTHLDKFNNINEDQLLYDNYVLGLLNYYVNHAIDLDELTELCVCHYDMDSLYYDKNTFSHKAKSGILKERL